MYTARATFELRVPKSINLHNTIVATRSLNTMVSLWHNILVRKEIVISLELVDVLQVGAKEVLALFGLGTRIEIIYSKSFLRVSCIH
jgi:hypothetical protein